MVRVGRERLGPVSVGPAGSGAFTPVFSVPLFLGVGDSGVLVLSYIVAQRQFGQYGSDTLGPDVQRLVLWCGVLLAIWLPVAMNHGAYSRTVVRHPIRSAYVVAKSTTLAGALFHLVPLVGGPVYSRITALAAVIVLVSAIGIWRLLVSRVLPRLAPRPLVVLGAGWAGQTLADNIVAHPEADVRIVAFVDQEPGKTGGSMRGIPVFPLAELSRLVDETAGRARVVLAIPDEAHAAVYEELSALVQRGVQLLSMAEVYEDVTGRVPVRHLGNYWWAMLPRPSDNLVYLWGKRLIDIGLALAGLALLTFLLPILYLLAARESVGPFFFSQRRLGRNGQLITVVKLRTLPRESVAFADLWERKRANKPTRIGALLRATGIDELPQCWNVLKGEMSIVGPRPYVADEVADFQTHIPFFRCRALIKPGLTGWAQVNWGYGLSLEDEIEKLQYDLYYIGHQAFYLDLLIMLRTIQLVLRRSRPNPVAIAMQQPSPVLTSTASSAPD